ncbi:glycosyltransferase [Chryseobacterium sp. SNU WT5]|uniref:glycosyltransferase family 2 protein n=1 Tax=Chryseobacterium sp. SNU WT5 TaxID=2594269 RepID=UPI00117F79D6|nr:glycosyltransferase [Chryseobacterium sp. SNU WT5]QDP85811.1 glycosyltransferase [Chryseobacterium sp. SNU WT5]
MGDPLVSVVVVSYNQAQFIVQNLDSLKSQTYTNWELIVADDASLDNSVIVFKNWLRENNISAKEIFHTKNTGLATVLNEAVKICLGQYVKFIAADDFMHPECLEKSVRCLEEKGKEYGMVFTDTFCVDENSQPLPDIADYNKLGNIPPEEFKKELIEGNRIAALTVLMRTSVVKETGEYDSKFIIEDYYRWLKISAKYLIAYIPEKLAYYRLHGENISKTKAERISTECLMLQLMFDHTGILKDRINNFFTDHYILKKDISKELLRHYNNYPFGMKILKFSISNNVPTFVFKIIYSISRRMNLKLR